MKIFQIFSGFCHWDASRVLASVSEAGDKFAPDMRFVEAPDYVFEGWGFDDTADGDARFIKPTPPDGWLYDDATGTFYESGRTRPAEISKSPEALALENAELKKTVAALEETLLDVQLAMCEMFESSIS